MLTVREQQLRAIEEARALDRDEAILRRDYSKACDDLGPEALSALVRRARERARGHGFELDTDRRRFIVLCLIWSSELGLDESTNWAAEILGWPDTAAGIRLTALEQYTQAELLARPELQERFE